MGILLLGMVALGLLLLLPILLLKVLFTLVFLPFRLLGLLGKLLFGALTGVAGLLFGLATVVFVAGGLVLAVLALPLLPLLLIGGGIWALARANRPRTALVRVG